MKRKLTTRHLTRRKPPMLQPSQSRESPHSLHPAVHAALVTSHMFPLVAPYRFSLESPIPPASSTFQDDVDVRDMLVAAEERTRSLFAMVLVPSWLRRDRGGRVVANHPSSGCFSVVVPTVTHVASDLPRLLLRQSFAAFSFTPKALLSCGRSSVETCTHAIRAAPRALTRPVSFLRCLQPKDYSY
jgi:hypothetical protein